MSQHHLRVACVSVCSPFRPITPANPEIRDAVGHEVLLCHSNSVLYLCCQSHKATLLLIIPIWYSLLPLAANLVQNILHWLLLLYSSLLLG